MTFDSTKQGESTQRIYAALKKSIVEGDLEGDKAGTVFDENRLAEEHKVSRAVIRDVLLALKDEGLVHFRIGEGVAIVRNAKRIWPIRYLRQHRPSIRLLILLMNLAPLALLLVTIFIFVKGDSNFSNQPLIPWLVLVILATVLGNVLVSLKLSEPIYAMRDIIDAQNRFAINKPRSPIREFFSRPLTREHKQLDEGVRHMYALSRDRQQHLERRAAEAEHFANHAIHEARNQVVSSIGALELITGDKGRMSGSERTNFLTAIKTNLQRLHALLDDWQAQAQSDRSMANEYHTVNLREILSYVSQVHSNKQFQVTFDRPTIDRTTIGFSGVRLESIISNLTDNSKQHGAGKVHITISTFASATSDEALEIVVTDDGPGIANSHEHKIFDEGFTTKEDPSGSGLGLFNVRSMLELHNGSIEVVSVEQGASFRIQIPLMV